MSPESPGKAPPAAVRLGEWIRGLPGDGGYALPGQRVMLTVAVSPDVGAHWRTPCQ
jgi:hypothetical protein